MAIMTRMLRLCKADVHGVMDQLEDKALLLKQSLREMEASLEIKTQQVCTLTRHIEALDERIAAQRREAEKLEQDLTLAVEKQKDDIARMLIRKRRTLAAASIHLNRQLEALRREHRDLSETLAAQQLQYETLKVQAEAFCRQADQQPGDGGIPRGLEPWASVASDEAEIELELLQRKEALQKGGTP